MKSCTARVCGMLGILLACTGIAYALEDVKVLLDPDQPKATATSNQVTFAASSDAGAPGLVVTIAPGGEGYPGVQFRHQPPLDLSGFEQVTATVTNLGDHRVTLHLRVDNPGDWRKEPWNTEKMTINPGETRGLTVRFGYSWGNPAFALDPAKISQIMLFTGKVKSEVKVRLNSLTASGKGDGGSTAAAATAEPTGPAGVAPKSGELLDLQSPAALAAAKPTRQVTVASSNEPSAPGMVVSVAAGEEGYPGVQFLQDPMLDLSKFGHVAARITNLSDQRLGVSLRIDNPGDWRTNPWNSENLYLQPNETGTCIVRFGYSWGKKGYALDPSRVNLIMIFTGKVKAEDGIKFRIESLIAGGKPGEGPPVKPADVRIVPKDGWLLGPGVKVDGAKQFATRGATAAVDQSGSQPVLKLDFPRTKGTLTATYKPEQGAWDLRQYLQLRVKVRNTGSLAVLPKVRLDSKGGQSDWASPAAPIIPGAEAEVLVPFVSKELWTGDKKDSGTRVTSDAGTGVTVAVDATDGDHALAVQSIAAELPEPVIPAWLGQRPPVDGDWVQTLNEEFDGSALNDNLWKIYTTNYWDKRSHFSKDNVILGDGMVRLRMEKKTGYHNDDTTKHQTDYAVGFLDTYGKWAQRYGYFEARMKLPTAPGLWPAFWMMPDRGEEVGPQWKRQDTANGGMEFDIMEHLTRWGPLRYNIALHWDGYQKNHKAIGTSNIYLQPDKDGFITSGLLWLPGKLVFYGNGQEVGRWENERVASVRSILILYMVTGGWDNNALDDKQLPADFVIDWVRVWQRKDLASDVDGLIKPAQN